MTAPSRTIPSALLLAALASYAGGAGAHAFLKRASPAVGSTGAAPGEVVIDFTEGVEPQFSTIAVTAANGDSVVAGPVHPAGAEDRLAVPVRPLAPGTYRVSWHATATDTHKTQGRFSFTVVR
ncbi:copper resistance protein CopC [Lichenicoccus roseus]|uniref:Copper resistance protein CopC n=1 Tax=Lichenicoccus roseus TaxID=2683649 RepID=A0A5R9J6K8_9PROT|nr:copper resistance protein CopC [Lichenicoccus roseus]TLU70986.1 copper resistance protein CopC [Lichenicoccus roseus]